MSPRRFDVALGLLLIAVILVAYRFLVVERGPKSAEPSSPALSSSSPVSAPPAPAASGTQETQPGPAPQPPGASASPGPGSGGGPLYFQDYLRGVLYLERSGQGLTKEQAEALLTQLRAFTASGGGGVGFYSRFSQAEAQIRALLTPEQLRWLENHRASIHGPAGPPERAAAAPATGLQKELEGR